MKANQSLSSLFSAVPTLTHILVRHLYARHCLLDYFAYDTPSNAPRVAEKGLFCRCQLTRSIHHSRLCSHCQSHINPVPFQILAGDGYYGGMYVRELSFSNSFLCSRFSLTDRVVLPREASSYDTVLNEITGDLFSCDASDALVHWYARRFWASAELPLRFFWTLSDAFVSFSVSEDLAMGKGIAVEFKKRFSSVNVLKAQKKKVGEVATLHVTAKQQTIFYAAAHVSEPEAGLQDRFVFYMITKLRYFHKPTWEDFSASLRALKCAALENHVSAISMPRIGCGLDKLEWKPVKQLLLETFSGTGVTINVYSL